MQPTDPACCNLHLFTTITLLVDFFFVTFSFVSLSQIIVFSYSEKKIAALSKEELKNWTHVGEAEQDDEDGENHTKK